MKKYQKPQFVYADCNVCDVLGTSDIDVGHAWEDGWSGLN